MLAFSIVPEAVVPWSGGNMVVFADLGCGVSFPIKVTKVEGELIAAAAAGRAASREMFSTVLGCCSAKSGIVFKRLEIVGFTGDGYASHVVVRFGNSPNESVLPPKSLADALAVALERRLPLLINADAAVAALDSEYGRALLEPA